MISEDGRKNRSGFNGGVVLIVLGVVFLLDTLHLVPDIGEIFRFWPVLLIALGISQLMHSGSDSRPHRGLFWIILGGVLLAAELSVFRFNVWGLLWPALLIWFGVHMLQGKGHHRAGITADSASTIDVTAVMSGVRRQYNSQEFKGGRINVVMGGCELDLRGATMPAGEAVLDVSVVMGGIDLKIPQDWTVVCRVNPVLAGIDDKTSSPSDGSKRLVIEGGLVMGGVDIKN